MSERCETDKTPQAKANATDKFNSIARHNQRHCLFDNAATTNQAIFSAIFNSLLEEIIVTSRKREEAITDVPLFINAMTEAQLEDAGIGNAQDYVGKMPSISKSGDFLSPGKEFMMMVIRGVGANGGMEPAAPVFLDGVYMPRLGLDTIFMDVERVEVLYGPQSTLFGRNTEAGAISIVTKRPSEEFRARVGFEWDEFDTYKAKASVSGQISDNWYAGVSIQGKSTRGFLKNAVTGASSTSRPPMACASAIRVVRWVTRCRSMRSSQ